MPVVIGLAWSSRSLRWGVGNKVMFSFALDNQLFIILLIYCFCNGCIYSEKEEVADFLTMSSTGMDTFVTTVCRYY
jgi:hypothetical protein